MRYSPCPPHCYFSCLSIPHIGSISKTHCQEKGSKVLANCSASSSCWFFSCSPSRPEMNCSKNPDFVLSGLSSNPDKPQILFDLFLDLYLLSLLGNLLLLLAIGADIHLHVPMYFFLSQLSLVDLCFTTTTAPKCWGRCGPATDWSPSLSVWPNYISS